MSLLFKKVRGRGGRRLFEGALFAILAERVGANSGDGAY